MGLSNLFFDHGCPALPHRRPSISHRSSAFGCWAFGPLIFNAPSSTLYDLSLSKSCLTLFPSSTPKSSSKMKPAFYAVLLTAVAAFVDAHGFLSTVSIDGRSYTGNVPGSATAPSAIRQITDIVPVKGASNPNLNCGLNATQATLVASANPGSHIAFNCSGKNFAFVRHTAVVFILESC